MTMQWYSVLEKLLLLFKPFKPLKFFTPFKPLKQIEHVYTWNKCGLPRFFCQPGE